MNEAQTGTAKRGLPLETMLLAGLLWLCALPLITTLVLPYLGVLVAALSAVAALGVAAWAAVALTPSLLRPHLAQALLHQDDRTATQRLHQDRQHSKCTSEARTGRSQP